MNFFKYYLYFVMFCLVFLGCDPNDPPEPITYPVSYLIDNYDYESPEYYLVTDDGLVNTEPSSSFSEHLNINLIENELVEVSEFFDFRSFTLTSDSTYERVLYDFFEEEEINFSGVYDRTDNEIVFWNEARTNMIPLSYNLQNDQFEWCEYVFSNTYWSTSQNTTRYAGFDFIACHFLPSDDPLAGYIDQNTLIETNDTLALLRLTRYFSSQ